MEVVIPLMIGLIVYVPLIFLSTRGLPPDQQRRIRPILLGAFFVRIVVSTIFEVIPQARVFHEDAIGTEYWSMRVASYWHNDGVYTRDWAMGARNYGLQYFFGGLLYVTGRFPLNITVFNSLLGTLNALLIYRIGLRLFVEPIARRAAVFMSFFPSMIIWSTIALKDPLMSFLICVTVLAAISLRERLTALAIAGSLLPMLAVYPIRFYLVYFMAASLIGTIALGRKGDVAAGASKQLVLFVGFAMLVLVFGFAGNAQTDAQVFDLERVSSYRQGMAVSASSSFAADTDISTPGRALMFLPIGVSTLLWGPFPWQMTSLRPLLSAPEMLVWWYLAPSLLRGFWFGVKKHFRAFSPIIVFALTMIVGYALTMGNLGAAYRMRAQVFNFLFLFAALGQYLLKVRKAGIDEGLLMKDPGEPVVAARSVRQPALRRVSSA